MFPKVINIDFKGKKFSLWVFGLITVLTLGRSLVHIFARDGGAQSIATIPLDTYTEAGANTIVLMFSFWGLSQLLMGFLYVIALWKYRSLIPFLYLLLFIEYIGRILLGLWKPIALTGSAPGGVGNYIMAPLALLMMILSLRNSKKSGR